MFEITKTMFKGILNWGNGGLVPLAFKKLFQIFLIVFWNVLISNWTIFKKMECM